MRSTMLIIASLIAVAVARDARAADQIRMTCKPTTAFICNHAGCNPVTSDITIKIEGNEYSRCDSRGCDRFRTPLIASGAFLVANPTSTTVFKTLFDGSPFKMQFNDSPELSFFETASAGLTTYTLFGVCSLAD